MSLCRMGPVHAAGPAFKGSLVLQTPSGRGNKFYKHSALLTPREVLNALVMAADVQVIGWEHWPFQHGVSMGDSVQQIE